MVKKMVGLNSGKSGQLNPSTSVLEKVSDGINENISEGVGRARAFIEQRDQKKFAIASKTTE